MRKPRDFDAELKALDEKARRLRERKIAQLGDLVIATGADALPADQLAGALLDAAETSDGAQKEAWHARGVAFFRGRTPSRAGSVSRDGKGDAPRGGGAEPADAGAGAS